MPAYLSHHSVICRTFKARPIYDEWSQDRIWQINQPGRAVLLLSSESVDGISMYGAVLARSKYPTCFVLSTTPFHMLATFRWSCDGALLQYMTNLNSNKIHKYTTYLLTVLSND